MILLISRQEQWSGSRDIALKALLCYYKIVAGIAQLARAPAW